MAKSSSTAAAAAVGSPTNVIAHTKSSAKRYTKSQIFQSRLASISTSIREKLSRRSQTTGPQTPHGHNSSGARSSSPALDWISRWLHPASLIIFLAISIGAGVALGVLIAQSHRHQGIATVGDDTTNRTIAGISVGRGLLWTFVPTLLVQIYSLCFKEIASALKERQPYIELREAGDQGVAANKSVLLDYAKQTEVVAVFAAALKGHFLISVTCFFSVFLSLVATPSASHLFVVSDNVQRNRSITLTQRVFYNESGIDERTNLASIVNYISSIQSYNASRPLWTEDEYSFPPLDVPTIASAAGTNVSLVVNASQLLPKCRALDEGTDWTIEANTLKQWQVAFHDGTCNITTSLSYVGSFQYYAQTYTQQNCPVDMRSSPSRILLFFAQVDRSQNFISRALVSCTTEYVNTTGQLAVSFTPAPLIRSFDNQSNHVSYPRPIFWQVFERNLVSVETNDNTATYSATALGRLVLEYARAQSNASMNNTTASATPPTPSALAASLQTNLAAAYAVAAASYLYSPIPNRTDDITFPAVYTIYNSRLVVVDVIAGALLGTFLFVAATMLAIFLHTLSHTSILKEEPKALLGSAILTYNSADIDRVASDLRARCPDGKCIEEYERKPNAKKGGTPNKYEDWKWTAQNPDSAVNLCIVKAQPAQPPHP